MHLMKEEVEATNMISYKVMEYEKPMNLMDLISYTKTKLHLLIALFEYFDYV